MSRRLKKLIKRFSFREDNRNRITLSGPIRLDPQLHLVTLTEPFQIAPATEAVVRTWITNPKSVKQWLSFEAVINNATEGSAKPSGEPILKEITGAQYRLGDGTDEFYWDGGAWAVSTTLWNTENDIADNIATFPVATQSLQVIVNLTTTDTAVAPELIEIKVLWASDIEFLEDLIYRTVVRSIRESVRPIADYVIAAPGGTSIDLTNFPLDTPYNIIGIDSVYDRTNDPDRLTDLFLSYDTGTQIITLVSAIAVNDLATVRFTYEPEVAVTTSKDFDEIAKVPAIVLEDVNLVNMSPIGRSDSIVRKSDSAATLIHGPMQGDLDVTLHGLTGSALDQVRLADEIIRYFENTTLLSAGLDEEYSLWLIDEYDMRAGSGSADFHTGRARFLVRDVLLFVRDSEDIFGVKRFLATGTEDFVISE